MDRRRFLRRAGAAGIGMTVARPLSARAASRAIPPTIPTPDRYDGFTIVLQSGWAGRDGDARDPEHPNLQLWQTPYLYATPYAADSGWLPGDRSGYGCAYMFLQYRGSLIGRVTFAAVKPPREVTEGYYGLVKDEEMLEGQRFFGGAIAPAGSNELGDCPGTAISYESVPALPDQRPRIAYWRGRNLVEIRDYITTETHPDLIFQLHEVINSPFTVTVPSGTYPIRQRVTVASYLLGVPQVIVYYDAIGNGVLSFEV